jgi:UDP-N-acetyl-D-mannosaminuronic acid dehydrogenase
LEPREGIGGHCLPKDTKMFLESSNRRRSKILRAAIEVDKDYKRFRAKLEKVVRYAYSINSSLYSIEDSA